MCADLYIAWSYYFDAMNNYKEVEAIFRKGIDAGAQPLEELANAHQAFSLSMSRRVLYDDETSQQQFQASMAEKRSALTSLRAHKKKFVGSLRTGIVVKDDSPGIVMQENVGFVAKKSTFEVLKTDEELAAQPLPANTSVIRSIVDSALKSENIVEAGTWNKAKIGKHGSLFGKAGASNHLDFAIMEDDNLPPIPCPEKLFEKGIQLPSGFVSRNKPQQQWDVSIVVQEAQVPRAIPCYEKFFLYPNRNVEISPDEYRGYKWFKDRNMKNKLTEQYDKIWTNTLETAIRLPPGFQTSNVKQKETEEFERFTPGEDCNEVQLPLHRMYPGEDKDELSMEELLAEKFRNGEIKLLTEEDFVETLDGDSMELTMIGDRRQSYYPASRNSFLPRKSIMPRKSILPPATVEEEAEEEVLKKTSSPEQFKSLGAIRKQTIKRKSNDSTDLPTAENMLPLLKKEFVSDTPPRPNFNAFKPPAAVEKKVAYPFTMDEDEQNDSCSTMQFNFFLKAQSVSTPVAKKNIPKLTPLATLPSAPSEAPSQQNENDVRTDGSISSNHCSVSAPTSVTQPHEIYQPKQLSTIMETTESTQSTKSSVGNETEFNMKTPKHVQNSHMRNVTKQEVESKLLLASFRLAEEQTETCPTMPVPIRMISQENVSQFMLKTPMKAPEVCPFQIFEDHSLSLPTPDLGISMKSHGSSSSSKQVEVTQIEIPESQNFENEVSCLVVPPDSCNSQNDIEIPATQDFDIPATQATEEELGVFAVPTIQNSVLNALQDPQRALSGNISSNNFSTKVSASMKLDTEIPAKQEVEATTSSSESGTDLSAYTISSEDPAVVDKPARSEFFIYEDSVREDKAKEQNKPLRNNLIASESLHMSCKENFMLPASSPVVRTPSEEFLAMCASPKSTSKKNATGVQHHNEISDLLKFSNATASGAALESSLKKLSLEPSLESKSATPTSTNFFDDDLNTEKFTLSLGAAKNSTLIAPQNKSPLPDIWDNDLDLSITIDSGEMERLGLSKKQNPAEAEFKVPDLPAFKTPAVKPSNAPENFIVFEDSDEDINDLSRSIYKPKPLIQQQLDDDEESGDEMLHSFKVTSDNQFEHTIVEDNDLSLKVQEMIRLSAGNPFDERLREAMLEHCNFSQYLEKNVPTCTLVKNIPQLKARTKVPCVDNEYTVIKLIGKGAFGSIYKAESSKDGKTCALKQEQPPNFWEYYISLELFDRLKDKRMMPAFLNIECAVIGNNSSILVTPFSPYGTIIDVCNKHKNKTNKNVDEYVVMVLTTQLLSIMDHLHACKIIHGDIKPDNFLMMSK